MTSIFPDKETFLQLSEIHKIIPILIRDKIGDKTPEQLYEGLSQQEDHSFVFETGKDGAEDRKYSFLCCNPTLTFKSKGNSVEIDGQSCNNLSSSPFTILQELLDKEYISTFDYLPHFYGGYVGYFAYDTVNIFENLPQTVEDDLDIPDIYLLKVDELIAFDHSTGVLKVICCVQNNIDAYETAIKKIRSIWSAINECPVSSICNNAQKSDINTLINKFDFIKNVTAVKNYIKEGDVYQANISHRLSSPYDQAPFNLYKNMRRFNPSPFSCFFKADNMHIISSSPERLVRVKNNKIDTRPIAGTRPRGENPSKDSELSKELLLNEKERAEHLMLIDLERNDLAKVCSYGSVEVDAFMVLEKYSHVWHIVSNVRGELKKKTNFTDIFKACFPGGTITGCPKVRCMEIIDELEATSRAYYTGSFGYIGYNREIDLNILIRTILVKNNIAYFHVGAGIVADSDPEKEYCETLDKAKAMIKAITNV